MTTDQAWVGARPGTQARGEVRLTVPGAATLVPGVSGARHEAGASRALVASLREALRGAVRVHVDVDGGSGGGPGTREPTTPWTRPVPDLGALGVDAALVAWRFTGNDDEHAPRAGVAATVALLTLGAAGWDGPVEVREAGPRHGRAGSTVLVERSC